MRNTRQHPSLADEACLAIQVMTAERKVTKPTCLDRATYIRGGEGEKVNSSHPLSVKEGDFDRNAAAAACRSGGHLAGISAVVPESDGRFWSAIATATPAPPPSPPPFPSLAALVTTSAHQRSSLATASRARHLAPQSHAGSGPEAENVRRITAEPALLADQRPAFVLSRRLPFSSAARWPLSANIDVCDHATSLAAPGRLGHTPMPHLNFRRRLSEQVLDKFPI